MTAFILAASSFRRPEASWQRRAIRFTTGLVAACLLLQRFGLPIGGNKSLSLVEPVGVALAGAGLAAGVLTLHRGRLLLLLAFLLLVLGGFIVHAAVPDALLPAVNLMSLFQFLLLTSFAAFSFAHPLSERAFFRPITGLLLLIAAAGVIEFALQFAGIRFFSFAGLLPASWLFEDGYNVEIPAGIGELLKSNGLFLVEPSVFSQMMALGLAIEWLDQRRPWALVLLLAGLLLSFSGTGLIVLAAFLASASGRGGRGAAAALAVAAVLAAAAVGLAVVAPDVAGVIVSRLDEITRPGTSGHMRFITPFWLLDDIFTRRPAAFLVGIGSGASEHITLSYEYDVNTPIKIGLEYGLPALACYLALFTVGLRSPMQRPLLLPLLVMFLFTGGYQQFPPMVLITLLITVMARLQPDCASAAASADDLHARQRAQSARADA